MTRVFDFTVVGVITIIAIVIHTIGINLFQPGSPLFNIATDGTQVMNGQQRAQLWFEIITIWAPMLVTGGAWCWAMIREFRRQAVTARQPAP